MQRVDARTNLALASKLYYLGVTGAVLNEGVLLSVVSAPTRLTIPYGVVGLADCCLSGVSSLEEVTIPTSVVMIGRNVFANCPRLRKIKVPSNLLGYSEQLLHGTNAKVVVKDA